MLMGENLDTGKEQFFTSWRSADDPSPGDFIFKFENHGLPMLLILSTGARKRVRTGPWNGIEFNGFPTFPKPVQDSVMVFNKGRLISIFDRYNSSVLTRLTLNESGSLQRYLLDMTKSKWNLLYSLPNNPCDEYGKCGPNGVCNSNISPVCLCLKGFTPKHRREWDLFDRSGGCVRNEPSNCVKGDGFLNVSSVKLPDMLKFELKMNMSLSECEAECLRNCSCTAYTNPYVNGGNSSCLMWYGDLVDIREYANEKSEQTVHIRVPISVLESNSASITKDKMTPLKVFLISVATAVLLLGLAYGCVVSKIKRNRRELLMTEEELELPLFDLATIAAATGRFAQENMIGQGGFGPVYKGILPTGQEVAVKRLAKDSGQGAEEFKNEVILIAKLQHRNLVRLLGCCIQGEERMLIYEYMPNKSLDKFIFNPLMSKLLTWPKRFDIILGIVRGLLYLHQDSRLKIIHRDLKTSNILLDSNLKPKISDFGLARILGGDQTFVETKRVMGTIGYMAPEYAMDGNFSEKSDVFSLGTLLLEIVSGKRNKNFHHPDHNHNLLGHAWLLWGENRSLEAMDPVLMDSFVEYQVKRCVQVALLCVQNYAEDRPKMSSVIFMMLSNETEILPLPKFPGFFFERSSFPGEAGASGCPGWNTGNAVTVTEMVPR